MAHHGALVPVMVTHVEDGQGESWSAGVRQKPSLTGLQAICSPEETIETRNKQVGNGEEGHVRSIGVEKQVNGQIDRRPLEVSADKQKQVPE